MHKYVTVGIFAPDMRERDAVNTVRHGGGAVLPLLVELPREILLGRRHPGITQLHAWSVPKVRAVRMLRHEIMRLTFETQ
ncbi:hypothetical protein MLGJGCBP_07720 [Rhodococcus sp. T7]|nr:hypothetical protein MLGJGCBP_09130 [Rhodococcus sp. T7]KAF0959207.1 hypothetical protein MLGJGCBP_07720 [Rhodococcus sp. T7]